MASYKGWFGPLSSSENCRLEELALRFVSLVVTTEVVEQTCPITAGILSKYS